MPIFPQGLRFGTRDDDDLRGGPGRDVLFGLGGDDVLRLGGGDDIAFGGRGADAIQGGAGDDVLFGDAGADKLTGGVGDDILFGGAGRDLFCFDPSREGEGDDVIADFRLGQDRIVLQVEDVLAATPGLAEAIVAGGGDVAAVLAGLDASPDWSLGANRAGDAVIGHPSGTITLAGVKAEGIGGFGDLAGALTVRGLGEALTALAPETGVPASIAAVVAASGTGFDDDGGDFDILLAAVEAAGLTPALADEAASLTVFAPTDAAFVSLAGRLGFEGEAEDEAFDFIVEALTGLGGGDPIGPLTDVLSYHVAAGSSTLGELQADRHIETLLSGVPLKIAGARLIDADPDFRDARVAVSDIQTGNGVIHAIDQVLLPLDL